MPDKIKLGPQQIKKLTVTRQSLLAHRFADFQLGPQKLTLKINGITHWEELGCVGFNPDSSQLEAVVRIKQSTGYSGNLCSNGSTEYVRFFVDWGDGGGFQDVGLTSFKAYDISDAPPGPQHPIDHMVRFALDDESRRKCCSTEVLPKVRAVLGWNQIPSLNPNEVPHFGDRQDARIQLRPTWSLFCLLKDQAITLKDPTVLEKVDLEVALKPIQPPTVAWSSLIKKYKRARIPNHRLVYDAVEPMISAGKSDSLAALQPDLGALKALKIDVSKVIEAITANTANTSFEELVCAGLDTATDTLGAVIHVKKPSGYSGTLCQKGSKEYVAFWADWDNNGSFDDYVGTVSVDVHDLKDIPDEGLFYAVNLPVNLANRLKTCANPNIVRIRAVLSWAVPPSTTDPNQLKTWGNRLDRLVRIRHSAVIGDGLLDLIYSVGSVPIENFSPTTHLAYPSAGVLSGACGQPAMDRPLGGKVRISGRIYNAGPAGSVHYQLQYSASGSSTWLPATTSATLRLAHPDPADPLHPLQILPVSSPDGWLPFMEDDSVSPPIHEQNAYLGTWNTNGLADGVYHLRMAYTPDYPVNSTIHYSDVVTVVVNNTAWDVSTAATNSIDLSKTLDLVIDGGDCHSYLQSDTIQGHLRVDHKYFHQWWFDLQPTTHTHGLKPLPPCRSYTSLSDRGDGNLAWSLPVTQGANKLDKCGYALTLWAQDRTIVNSNSVIVHRDRKAVGFSII